MRRRAVIPREVEAEADRIIGEFAAALLRLTGGGQVPTYWKAKITKALAPAPRRPGPPVAAATYQAIAKLLAKEPAIDRREVSGGRIRRNRSRTGDEFAESGAEADRRIAAAVGVSVRTVQRVRAELKRILDRADTAPLDTDARKAILVGVAEEIIADLDPPAPRRGRRPR